MVWYNDYEFRWKKSNSTFPKLNHILLKKPLAQVNEVPCCCPCADIQEMRVRPHASGYIPPALADLSLGPHCPAVGALYSGGSTLSKLDIRVPAEGPKFADLVPDLHGHLGSCLLEVLPQGRWCLMVRLAESPIFSSRPGPARFQCPPLLPLLPRRPKASTSFWRSFHLTPPDTCKPKRT